MFDAITNTCICPIVLDYFIVNSSVCFKDLGCIAATDNETCTTCDSLNNF
jgi:hypothetical protein